ncbi:single-stranded DNA-binding protein [Streptococcus infantarius subsp. infantarius]|uniref:single-stranded DNA-binding protein n=1 Tax=Streptococcus infantarius TaxID=102684 RepID=UPI001BDA256A|nr:single-stranded DNA-binding protein [Streptococcus infantarius]MBT0903772.1 single-stranded DNA-binding protein [Streptococcus infantarius subsp. infantarius]MBT0917685.1 single-stranded DNA-binding protein [Streptococcus infantarius subsp. infantarius]
MNNVNLIGRLTKAPELKQTASNTSVLTGTLAVNRTFKNQNGEREADFINIVAWRQTADIIAQYCGKGSQIGVTGRIQTRNYENQQGQRVYVTEVVAEHVDLLDSKSDNQQSNFQNQGNFQNSQRQNANNSYQNQNNNSNSNPMDISDDDLPF